jgi:transposase
MMLYCEQHGSTKASIRYGCSRKTVYKWRSRWDGSVTSLEERSRRPLSNPRKQSRSEEKLVKRYARKYPKDHVLGYQKASEYGYKRSYGCYKRTALKVLGKPKGKLKKHNKPKPYQRADYPGQKIQMDVKYVPNYCISNGLKYYQFTAKDECSRWTFREMYDEHSTFSARDFLVKLIMRAPFPIRLIQTDNGTEFTNTLLVTKSKHKTMFEDALEAMGILYQRIRIATPRHNGKVERQHRTDEMRFYKKMRMYNLEDGRRQLAVYQSKSNDYIMTCLKMKSPNQILEMYRGVS